MVLGGRAYWVAGRYHNDFRREDGSWRIRHTRVEGIFEAPYDRGWARAEFFQRQTAPATGLRAGWPAWSTTPGRKAKARAADRIVLGAYLTTGQLVR